MGTFSIEMVDDIVPDVNPLRSYGTQHANYEELRIFWSTNYVYDMTRLKYSGHLILDVAL